MVRVSTPKSPVGPFPIALPLRAMINPHTHLREDTPDIEVVKDLIAHAVAGGAAVLGPMPNTVTGLTTAGQVIDYIAECKRKSGKASFDPGFIPIVQITEHTTPQNLDYCIPLEIYDGKVYPFERTTNSENGVRDYWKLIPILQYAGTIGMRIHLHPEIPNMIVENRDAEWHFVAIMDMLMRSTEDHGTVFVWEHGTDSRCIPHWKEWAQSGRFYITLTAHHLATNESETFGDVQATCKPSIKTLIDQRGLVGLVAEDHDWVMAGADDAPHPKEKKHVYGKCACGAYTAPFIFALYAHALHSLLTSKKGMRIFASFMYGNAARMYKIKLKHLPMVELSNTPMTIPKTYQVGPWTIETFWAGKKIGWSMKYL